MAATGVHGAGRLAVKLPGWLNEHRDGLLTLLAFLLALPFWGWLSRKLRESGVWDWRDRRDD